MQITNQLQDAGLLAAVAIAHGVVVGPSSDSLKAALLKLAADRKNQVFPPVAVKDAVRNLLKTQHFKPSGRNKPASEYLAQAAREDRFPIINNLVDINNYVSLSSGLPISLLDADVVGNSLILRQGKEGERYVFNAAGQDIDLHGLICACAGATDTALGNPVKDSVAGKIKDATNNVVFVIYTPNTPDLSQVAKAGLETFAQLLRTEGQAKEVETIMG